MDLRKMSGSQLKDLIRKAEKRQRQMVKGLVAEVRAKVKALIKAAGLTVAEVFPATGAKRGPGRPPKAAAAKSASKGKKKAKRGYKVKPKYRNPDNPSQSWAGRGLKPRWYRQALASGRKEKDLLIG